MLTLECLRTKLLGLLNDTILQALWAYKFSVPASVSSGRGVIVRVDLMGAVKERRIPGGGAALSGVLGTDARAIADILVRRMKHTELKICTHRGRVSPCVKEVVDDSNQYRRPNDRRCRERRHVTTWMGFAHSQLPLLLLILAEIITRSSYIWLRRMKILMDACHPVIRS